MAEIGIAFEMAFDAHAGQTDKSGEPYIAHVVRVAACVGSDEERVVALLHDVVEDTHIPLSLIEATFGHRIAEAVDAITMREGEDRMAYYARVAADPLARAVKLCDLADNESPARLARLDAPTRERLLKKYAAARAALGAG